MSWVVICVLVLMCVSCIASLQSSCQCCWGSAGSSLTDHLCTHPVPSSALEIQTVTSCFKPTIHLFCFHLYADDTQLHLSLIPNDFNTLSNHIQDISCWISQNVLQLNLDKTEVIIVGPGLAGIKTHLGLLLQNIAARYKNVAVIFDKNLSLNHHVNTNIQSCLCSWEK